METQDNNCLNLAKESKNDIYDHEENFLSYKLDVNDKDTSPQSVILHML